jgi:glycosyltransferase involved in cell wall biosynthesis
MRVAYLTADFGVPVLGTKGASAHVRGLVEALRSEGHDLFVLAANIGDDADPPFPLRQVAFGGALLELYDALQNESICEGNRLAKDLRNLLYASNLELQGRLMLEDFGPDLIYERHCLFSTAGRELSRYFDVPLILELNAPLLLEQQKMRGLSLPLVAQTAERLVLTAADHVVTVSQALRTYATDLGVPPDRVSVIPNGVDPDMFGPGVGLPTIKQQLGWTDRFVIGFVGSMKPWHGVETLLQTLHLLGGADSPFRLLLVGSGPMLTELEERSRQLGLDGAVHMTGAVTHHAVPDLLRAMDVTVVTYAADADEYFSPVKLFEYMAMALPVVAARVGQVREVIDEGRTGWLCTPGDASELARLIRMLEGDRDLCRAVGAAARERVLNEYTWRHNARRVMGIAEDLIDTRKPRGRPERTGLSLDAANLALAGGGAGHGAARPGTSRALRAISASASASSSDNSGPQR